MTPVQLICTSFDSVKENVQWHYCQLATGQRINCSSAMISTYPLYDMKLAIMSVLSYSCVCIPQNLFCTHAYTLCRIRFAHQFDRVISKMCSDVACQFDKVSTKMGSDITTCFNLCNIVCGVYIAIWHFVTTWCNWCGNAWLYLAKAKQNIYMTNHYVLKLL